MNKSIVWRIILVVILAAAIIGFAAFAYNAGVSQGMAVNVQTTTGQPVPAPVPYYGYWHWGPWFPGFGILACLVPLFFFFLFFVLLRGIFFWGGPRRWGYMHHGGMGPMGEKSEWREHIHSTFNEWHDQAHSETGPKSE